MAGWTQAKRQRAAQKAVATKRRTGVLRSEARKAVETRRRRSHSPYG